MKRIVFYLFFMIAGIGVGHAQADKRTSEILNRISENLSSSQGTEIEYRLSVKPASEPEQLFHGTLRMKGEKFQLESPDVSVWFNGKEQWSLNEGSDEVNLTEPDDEELQSINPYFLLKDHSRWYESRLKSEKNGKAEIELIPKETSSSEYERIVLDVDTRKGYPNRITLSGRDKSVQTITVTAYRDGLNFADSQFVFDAKSHPDKEINDLR